jgi:2-oxoglutarate dehydrogenase complex dehydrogenase (E1) component-like enzyme
VRRLQHPGLHPGHAGADVLPAAPADDPALAQAAHHLHAQEPAAAQGIGVAAAEFAESKFKAVNGEWDESIKPDKVKRVDPVQRQGVLRPDGGAQGEGLKDVAIVRIAQLYPFPHDEFQAQIDLYRTRSEVIWCQEEPGNQGAWHRIQHYCCATCGRAGARLCDAQSSASPAAGYLSLHNEQQKELVEAAFAPLTTISCCPCRASAEREGRSNAD